MNGSAAWEKLTQRIISCCRCPRLVSFRQQVAKRKRASFREQGYWSRPVPGFGDRQARLLVVGLAPAAHGANRTGRMFTGDGPSGAGNFLMRALHELGLASLPYSQSRDDGLVLRGVFLSAVVRCVPPGNRPKREEIENCLPFLVEELKLLTEVRAVLALGRVAFSGCLRAFELAGFPVPLPRPKFSHGAAFELGGCVPTLVASYHPSRQNTQTGRLTPDMFREAVQKALAAAELSGKQGLLA